MRDRSSENRRNYYRYNTFDKLLGKMIVLSIDDMILPNNELGVTIHDISEGGFSFLSDSYIDMKQQVIISVDFRLMDFNCMLKGEVLRLDKYIGGYKYLYGVELLECNHADLYKLLVKTGLRFEKVNRSNSSVL